MRKIFILCSGIILAPSLGWAGTHGNACTSAFPNAYCSAWAEDTTSVNNKICTCTSCTSTARPNQTSMSGSKNGYTLYSGCSCQSCSCSKNPDTSKRYGSCSCSGGVADYSTCTVLTCKAGTYKSGTSCVNCAVGTYSTTTNATSCTTCPALDGAYGDYSRTKAVNVANGYVTTASTGSDSINDCYIKYANYYDTSGTFTFGGTCAYDGTVVVDKCPASSITGACLSTAGTVGEVISGEKTNALTGIHCWCNMNGKTVYIGQVGTTSNLASCNNTCTASAACYSLTQASYRTKFGCD